MAPPTTHRERRNLEKDLFPYLGARSIGQITPIELLAAIRRVEERGFLMCRIGFCLHRVACGNLRLPQRGQSAT
jgi:hypothetical protein